MSQGPDLGAVVYYFDDKNMKRAKAFGRVSDARAFYIQMSMEGRSPILKIKKDRRT